MVGERRLRDVEQRHELADTDLSRVLAENVHQLKADRVHPEVLEVMREVGIELADRTPRLLTQDLAEEADLVVTMGCGDACPVVPGKRYLDWDLPDPRGMPLGEVRKIRDEIISRAQSLATELAAR